MVLLVLIQLIVFADKTDLARERFKPGQEMVGQSILGIVCTTILRDCHYCVFRCRTVSLVTPLAAGGLRNQLHSLHLLGLPLFMGDVGQ